MARPPLAAGGFLLAVLAALSSPAAGQEPARRPARPLVEPRGRDFRAGGAWRVRADRIRILRAALLRSGQVAALNGAAPAAGAPTAAAATVVAGTFNVPVLLVRPSNVSAPFPAANYQQTLFATTPPNGKPYTVHTFYQQLSNGFLSLGGTVLGWFDASQTDTYYEDGCNGIGVVNSCPHGGLRLGELFVGALTAADTIGTDWGQFDNDGPDGIPNSGDDDGYVDFVAFIHPDIDGACGTPHIWSHRFVLSAITGDGQPYITRTPAHNGGFIKVEDYIVQSGIGGSTACTGGKIMPVGTVSHEIGHAFGLPDLYDTDGHSAGIGYWGLMGAGNYASPDSPARMEAWSLAELGWINVQPLGQGQTSIAPITQSHTAYAVPITTSGRDEYYLLENRQAFQADTALLNPVFGGGPGLLIWHIDNDQIAAHGISSDNRVNAGPIHGVELVQADGLGQLDVTSALGGNFGDGGDPFPGSAGARRLAATTRPAAVDNGGSFVGYLLDQFTPQNGDGTGANEVRYTVRARSVITSNRPDISLVVAGSSGTPLASVVVQRFDDVLAPGDAIQVTAPAQEVSGRTAAVFERWSNGRPAAFIFSAASGAPDTLLASYQQESRVLVQFTGTGGIESSLAGVLYSGAFRPDTTTVTLQAVPGLGASFLGWSGDTSAADPLLVLPGGKPYDLTATFTVSAQVIAIVDAAKALMGGPALADEVSAALDQDGNNNGKYDLGDFLAYLDRTHATLSPALLQQLLARAGARPAAAAGAGH